MDTFEQYAKRENLELIFSKGHHSYGRIYYDFAEGKYYDRETDLYLLPEELKKYGLGT